MKIPNPQREGRHGTLSLARIVSEDSQLRVPSPLSVIKSSKDS